MIINIFLPNTDGVQINLEGTPDAYEILRLLSSYWVITQNPVDNNFNRNKHIIQVESPNVIYRGNEHSSYTFPYNSSYSCFKIICHLIRSNLCCDQGWHYLHASAISFNNKCYCFLGNTFAGKSTLTAFLSQQQGVKYVSDDLVILNTKQKCIMPYQKNILLREGSISILRKYDFDIKSLHYNPMLERFIYIPKQIEEQALPIGAIFLMQTEPPDTAGKQGSNQSIFLENSYFSRKNIKNNILSSITMDSIPISNLPHRDLSLTYQHIVNGRFL